MKGILSPTDERLLYKTIKKEFLKPGIKNWVLRILAKMVTRKIIKAFDNIILDKLPEDLKQELILIIKNL